MKLLAVSDIHGRRSIVQKLVENSLKDPPDLIVVAGDLSNGSFREAIAVLEIFRKSRIKTVFVPGNMDPPSLLTHKDNNDITMNVHLRVVSIDEIIIAGIGGSNITPFNTFIEFGEEEIKKMLDEIASKINNEDIKKLVMVTHVPPYETSVDKVFTGSHVGSNALREFIELKQPLVLITGHIHEARGIDKLGSTLIVNPGPLFRGYYAVIYISKGKDNVHAELHRLHG